MSKGPAYRGGSPCDTVFVVQYDTTLIKQCIVPEWYDPELLLLYAGRLFDRGVVTYQYDSVEKLGDRLTITRPFVEGTPILDTMNLAHTIGDFQDYVAHLVLACKCEDFCFIPTEVSELHNVLVSADGTLNLVDVETSFIVTRNMQLGVQYLGAVANAMVAEFNRVVLLEQIETIGS